MGDGRERRLADECPCNVQASSLEAIAGEGHGMYQLSEHPHIPFSSHLVRGEKNDVSPVWQEILAAGGLVHHKKERIFQPVDTIFLEPSCPRLMFRFLNQKI